MIFVRAFSLNDLSIEINGPCPSVVISVGILTLPVPGR